MFLLTCAMHYCALSPDMSAQASFALHDGFIIVGRHLQSAVTSEMAWNRFTGDPCACRVLFSTPVHESR